MKNQPNSTRSVVTRLFLGLVIAAGALLASSCAYQETMKQRNAEEQYLQQQLQAEQARAKTLTR